MASSASRRSAAGSTPWRRAIASSPRRNPSSAITPPKSKRTVRIPPGRGGKTAGPPLVTLRVSFPVGGRLPGLDEPLQDLRRFTGPVLRHQEPRGQGERRPRRLGEKPEFDSGTL